MPNASAFVCVLLLVVAAIFTTGRASAESEWESAQQHAQADRPSRADRVCCRRNWQNWWTTRQYCADAAGGREVANRECRNNWNERWDSRWWSWEGGTWNTHVCCRQGASDRWTNARDCRDTAGFPTATRFCSRAF